jgi:hypothetical protein
MTERHGSWALQGGVAGQVSQDERRVRTDGLRHSRLPRLVNGALQDRLRRARHRREQKSPRTRAPLAEVVDESHGGPALPQRPRVTSAPTEARSGAGASGNWPRIAWLPTTTISSSLAISPAARSTCSSSPRVTSLCPLRCHVAPDLPPLLGREDAGKRARLAQLTSQLTVIDEKRRDRLDVTA